MLQRQVHIFDKRGKPYYHITLPAPDFPCNEALSGTRALQVLLSAVQLEYALQPVLSPPCSLAICPEGTSCMQWDMTGELLAILPHGNSYAMVWTAATSDLAHIEAGFKVRPAE